MEVSCAARSSSACSPSSSLGLVGGTLAFFVAQKSVTLTVDGQVRHVGTYADTVGEVLDEEGLSPPRTTSLLPAAGDAVRDGDTVVLNRARPLELTVDGVSREVYVTALSVDEALGQLGYRADDLVLSASRSERLPLRGHGADDHHAQGRSSSSPTARSAVVTTTAATAGDLLAEQGIALSADRPDQPLPRPGAARPHAAAGLPGAGDRGRRDHRDRRTSEVETPDPERLRGRRDRDHAGRRRPAGHPLPRHRHRRRRDRPRGPRRRPSPRPVTEQVTVGTKPRAGQRARSADGLNWAALAQCESGGNPRAVNAGGYYGLYQFSLQHLGVASAARATRRRVARRADRPGADRCTTAAAPGQWGCGCHLFD